MHHRIANKTDSKVSGTDHGAKVQPGGPSDARKSGGNSVVADNVVLTERSQMLARLEKAAADLPAVDAARVEAVKADIANGNYEIDVDNIAEILLQQEQELDE